MLMKEFASRFVSQDERSFLFEILRRVSTLDTHAMAGTDATVWQEWPPVTDGSGTSGLGVVGA